MNANPISIRLDEKTKRRAQAAAALMGLGNNVSAVVKLSLTNQLAEIESGHIKLRAVK